MEGFGFTKPRPTMTNPSPNPEKPEPRKLSGEIDGLLATLGEHPITLREIIAVIHGRAYTLLLVLMSLPFCLPVPLMGLSTVIGTIIALIGLRLSMRLEPWLPDRILDAPIASHHVARLLKASKQLARALELLLRPRWCVLVDWVVLHHVYGAMICISGLLLLLPLPIPFSNLLPGLTVIFLAAALIERDGLFVVAGIITFVITCFFFAAIFAGGVAAANWMEHWFGGIFQPNEMPPPELHLPVPTETTP